MRDHHVPIKSSACRRLLSERDASIARAQRALLIMVDGRRTVAELRPAMAALRLDLGDLQALTAAGLLHWQRERVSGQRSVAGAKLYALDLLGRMLARDDLLLREAARAVTAEADLLPWLQLCRHVLGERINEQRAALFIDQVCQMLPDEWVELWREPLASLPGAPDAPPQSR